MDQGSTLTRYQCEDWEGMVDINPGRTGRSMMWRRKTKEGGVKNRWVQRAVLYPIGVALTEPFSTPKY